MNIFLSSSLTYSHGFNRGSMSRTAKAFDVKKIDLFCAIVV